MFEATRKAQFNSRLAEGCDVPEKHGSFQNPPDYVCNYPVVKFKSARHL